MNENTHPLRAARKMHGWTLAYLAERSGVSIAAISRIETRKRRPSAETVAKLARALGSPLADLLDPWVEDGGRQ